MTALIVLAITACSSTPTDHSTATSPPTAASAVSTSATTKPTTPSTHATQTTVAAQFSYLSDLTTVNGSLVTGSAEVNGTRLAHSLLMDLTFGPDEVEYNLSRDWQHLQATVGLRDDAASNAQVRMEAFGDQRPLYSHVFALGESEQINLDVPGVLRLRLVATLTSNPNDQATAVWGDAGLTG